MIDARGLSCPQPVLLVQKAQQAGETEIKVTVDNMAAVENITRFAGARGYTVDKAADGADTVLTLTKK